VEGARGELAIERLVAPSVCGAREAERQLALGLEEAALGNEDATHTEVRAVGARAEEIGGIEFAPFEIATMRPTTL